MTRTDASTDAIASAFQSSMEGGDRDAVAALLSEEVRLDSPLTARFTFDGRDSVADLLAAVHATFDEFRYTERVRDGDRIMLRSSANVGGEHLDEVALLRIGADGLIAELTIFMRPLTATAAVVRQLAPRVARDRAGAGAAFGAARLGCLVGATTRLADRLGANAMRGAPGITSS